MNLHNKAIDLIIGKKKFKINYAYNNYTKYQDLLEYVFSLFPDLKLCPCCIFANRYEFINSDTLIIDNDDIDRTLSIEHLYQGTCQCNNENIKKMYRKSKREIIEQFTNNKNNNMNEYVQKINDLEMKDKQKDKSIYDLKRQNESQKETISDLRSEINSLRQQINNLENKSNILEKKKKEMENEINELQNQKNLLVMAVNGDLREIDKLKNYGIQINYKGEDLITINPDNNQIIGKKESKKVDFKEFYDVIVNIKSIKDINKGWEIKMTDKGLGNYKKYHEDKIIKIGIIGNSNKGKSFLLSKISKMNFPSGTSIRTEGLSVKYPELDIFTDRKIALLDSAGLETPVLKKEEDKNMKLSEKDLFKEKSREKLITELFLQNYIISVSDILIIVVGILTYSEQKLLNRIKTEIQRAKIKRPLFIIHNLITYTTVAQIEDYIKEYLLESATFNLEKGHGINTKAINEKESGVYYFEKNSDPKIYHLIFANADSEAGSYYNRYTLDFLEKSFINVTDLKPFDVIQSIKERFVVLSKEIMEFNEKKKEISINDFSNNENLKMIKLNDEREITLKKCLIDELGFSNLKGSGYEPTCNYFKLNDNGQEKLEIRIESPGNTTIRPNIDYVGEYTIIKIKGNKDKDKFPNKLEDNIHNSREFGDFSLEIPLKTEDYLIKNQKPDMKQKNGLIILQYLLDEKIKDDEEFKVTEEV